MSDIHGCVSELKDALLDSYKDRRRDHWPASIYVFLGDYIDRGPASFAVINLLLFWAEQNRCIFLRGNHEVMVENFLGDAASFERWREAGGIATLQSYDVSVNVRSDLDDPTGLAARFAEALPQSHLSFFADLLPFFECGDFFFAHAGVRPGVPLEMQRSDDLMWIRDEFLDYEKPFEKIIVHGHTPVEQIDIKTNRINIDTGVYLTGRLSCLVIEGRSVRILGPV